MDIAKVKGEELSDIQKYDLADNSMLYDGDIMAKHDKSKIVGQKMLCQKMKS